MTEFAADSNRVVDTEPLLGSLSAEGLESVAGSSGVSFVSDVILVTSCCCILLFKLVALP